ncbi:haloacid dehalogenase type II [soil metagenome]
MKKICVFDVNETLLDLSALDPEFERVFGDKAVRKEWFGQFMVSMLVATVTDAYSPFGEIGSAAFDMVAKKRCITVPDEDKKAILTKVASLPPHPEVAENLARLKAAGYELATLTNSTPEVAEKQLENSNLAQYFDKILSADTIKRLKPAKEVYEMAARSYGVEARDIRLVAAHAWDIAGALRAGCRAAFVARPGMVLDPLVDKPDIVGKDLKEVVDKIITNKQ